METVKSLYNKVSSKGNIEESYKIYAKGDSSEKSFRIHFFKLSLWVYAYQCLC